MKPAMIFFATIAMLMSVSMAIHAWNWWTLAIQCAALLALLVCAMLLTDPKTDSTVTTITI